MNNELMHYGVLGMKWGVRKASKYKGGNTTRKDVRTAVKENRKAYNQAYKSAVKANNTLIGKNRRAAANKQYSKDFSNWTKTNDKYLKTKEQYKAQKAKKKLDSRTTKETQNAIKNLSTGQAVARTMLYGSYGSVVYTSARTKGVSKGKAAAQAITNNWANNLTLGQLSRKAKW